RRGKAPTARPSKRHGKAHVRHSRQQPRRRSKPAARTIGAISKSLQSPSPAANPQQPKTTQRHRRSRRDISRLDDSASQEAINKTRAPKSKVSGYPPIARSSCLNIPSEPKLSIMSAASANFFE